MGTGPVSRKIGRRVVYAQADLDDWTAAREPNAPIEPSRSEA
jgi:hypothetical protein